jgi:hypothetical protein
MNLIAIAALVLQVVELAVIGYIAFVDRRLLTTETETHRLYKEYFEERKAWRLAQRKSRAARKDPETAST